VRWSPCGWHFAVGNHDATALIIDTKNMGCLRLGGFGGKVSQLAWSADGRHLAVATCDARVAVFEIQTP
jgi:WD40 repeat protein